MISDTEIKKCLNSNQIKIEPFNEKFLGGTSYYCHIGNKISRVKENHSILPLDTSLINFDDYFETEQENYEPFIIEPKEFLLIDTFESFGTDNEHIIKFYNSSQIARLGISQNALGYMTAGVAISSNRKLPHITLEIVNNSPFPIKLFPTKVVNDEIIWGTEILKVSVEKIIGKVQNEYDKWKFNINKIKDGDLMKSKIDKRFT